MAMEVRCGSRSALRSGGASSPVDVPLSKEMYLEGTSVSTGGAEGEEGMTQGWYLRFLPWGLQGRVADAEGRHDDYRVSGWWS